MSSDIRLGPVSYLVLGITALRGPSTPYDLKRFVQLSIGHFWPFPHTQLYAEPARLAEAGLLDETREQDGRRRRHYTITDAGRERLDGVARRAGHDSANEIRDLGSPEAVLQRAQRRPPRRSPPWPASRPRPTAPSSRSTTG